MARTGSFQPPTEEYGNPLSVVHPTDNNVLGSKYHDLLMDPKLKLTEQERSDLEAQIKELWALLRMARDL